MSIVLTIKEAQLGLRMNYSNYIGFTWIRLRAQSQVSVEQMGLGSEIAQ